jgi:hypothetical protein
MVRTKPPVEVELPLEAEEPPAVPGPPPIPTVYRWSWWPAMVRLPDGTTYPQVKVYATSEGLYVYTTPASTPAYYTPVDYDKTRPPSSSYPANQKTVRIWTPTDEQITIQPLQGCGCGNPLKQWRPEWAYRVEAWS